MSARVFFIYLNVLEQGCVICGACAMCVRCAPRRSGTVSYNLNRGGGTGGPQHKSSVRKALLIVSIFLVATFMPLIGVFGGEGFNSSAYRGDEYTVTYTSGDLPEGVNRQINTNIWKKPESVEVTYYGVPVAEYNPQCWVVSGEATTYGLANANVIENWYHIENYVLNETNDGKEQTYKAVVFVGWKITNGNGESDTIVDPGERLDEYCVNGQLTLEAQWKNLDNYSDSLDW